MSFPAILGHEAFPGEDWQDRCCYARTSGFSKITGNWTARHERTLGEKHVEQVEGASAPDAVGIRLHLQATTEQLD